EPRQLSRYCWDSPGLYIGARHLLLNPESSDKQSIEPELCTGTRRTRTVRGTLRNDFVVLLLFPRLRPRCQLKPCLHAQLHNRSHRNVYRVQVISRIADHSHDVRIEPEVDTFPACQLMFHLLGGCCVWTQ